MHYQKIEMPRLSLRGWNIIRDGLPRAGRYRRYFMLIGLCVIAIWALTAAYIVFMPKQYESHFTLILPGSGAGGSLNVESIGQAQSTASSAFSSPTLSPTENYKRLLMSDVTLRTAAKSSGEPEGSFPDPTITLIDQTNLITVSVKGKSAQQSTLHAQSLRNAFLAQLDRLRADEAEKREASDSNHLIALEAKVREAQRKLLQFQATNGLVSLDQFNNRIAGIDALREKEREARTLSRLQSAEAAHYSSALGTSSGGANQILRLRSDPIFQKLAESYAALDVNAEQKSATLGNRHADMAQADSERNMIRAAMIKRGRELTGLSERALLQKTDLSVSDGRSSLLSGMIEKQAQSAGAAAGLSEIRSDLARQTAKASKLVEEASVLADLTRDHRVAEAVFSTALARLDTNKQDPFASYPLVQTLEEPSHPIKPSSPSKKIALAGALGATLLLLMGFGLLWFRQPVIRKILPKN